MNYGKLEISLLEESFHASVQQRSIIYSRVLKLDMPYTCIQSNEKDPLKNIDRTGCCVCFDGSHMLGSNIADWSFIIYNVYGLICVSDHGTHTGCGNPDIKHYLSLFTNICFMFCF